MNKKDISKFYDDVGTIVEVILNHANFVKMYQKDFAAYLNRLGIIFYNLNRYPKSKALFWVASVLGNHKAGKNYLCVYLW